MGSMERQLTLLEESETFRGTHGGDAGASPAGQEQVAGSWRIDERTREVGLAGIAAVRAALRRSATAA